MQVPVQFFREGSLNVFKLQADFFKSGRSPSLRFWLFSDMHTAESDFSNFMIKYLGKVENPIRACFNLFLSGLDGVESWKNRGRTILWHPPFKIHRSVSQQYYDKYCTLIQILRYVAEYFPYKAWCYNSNLTKFHAGTGNSEIYPSKEACCLNMTEINI